MELDSYPREADDELRRAAELTEAATSSAREACDDIEMAGEYAAQGRTDLAVSMLTAADSTLANTVEHTAAAAIVTAGAG